MSLKKTEEGIPTRLTRPDNFFLDPAGKVVGWAYNRGCVKTSVKVLRTALNNGLENLLGPNAKNEVSDAVEALESMGFPFF